MPACADPPAGEAEASADRENGEKGKFRGGIKPLSLLDLGQKMRVNSIEGRPSADPDPQIVNIHRSRLDPF